MRVLFAAILLVLSSSCAAGSSFDSRASISGQIADPTAVASHQPGSALAAGPAPATTPARSAYAPSATLATGITVRDRLRLPELPGAGRDPYSIALLGDKVYVANSGSNNVAVLQANRLIAFIPVGRRPSPIVADPAAKRIYVANAEDKTLSLIVDDVVTRTIGLGDAADALLLLDNRLFVGMDSTAAVLALDPASLQTIARIPIDKASGIINLAGDATRHRLYVDIYEEVAIVDSINLQVVSTFETPGNYYALASDAQDGTVLTNAYDTTTNSQWLVAYDPTTGVGQGRVAIGGDPRGVVVNSSGSRVYVANSYTNDVSVVDPRSMTRVATVPVGMRPAALALDEKARRLYVANSDGDSVNVVDTESNLVLATVPLAYLPTALIASESTGRVYVANASSDSVFVIQGGQIAREVPVGRHPIDLALDEQSKRVFVANAANRTLSTIDEADLAVRSTDVITRFLSTIAVDAPHGRAFAGDVVLDLRTLQPVGRLTLHGVSIGSVIGPDWIRVNPNNNRIYALGWNGTPGSNSRTSTYSVDGDTLESRGMFGYYGNVSAVAIDPVTNDVYVAGTHPLAYTNELGVFDADDRRRFSLPLPGRTVDMAYNPQTHHLFIAHTAGYGSLSPTPSPAERTVEVYDTTSFGLVATLSIGSTGKMTRLGDTVYIAGREDGVITLIQDAALPVPPSPTPTRTRTPYATSPPASPAARATALPACAIQPAPPFTLRMTGDRRRRIGCPTQAPAAFNFAVQRFEHGTMLYRSEDKRIIVLYDDRTWSAFDDRWTDSAAEDSCPSITVAAGLVKPKRGFGKVWCDQPAVRSKAGLATGTEAGLYAAPVQAYDHGQVLGGSAGEVYVLFDTGRWE